MIDFAPWDALLRQYVDTQGRVDYQAWKREKPQALAEWLASLDPQNIKFDDNQNVELALWINLYNALTISTILERYPIDSILPKILGIPNWLAFLWFFYRPAYRFSGRRYSLSQIEHKMLRKKFQDPRIHFAIVCASIGCPLLRNNAYWPETVQQQLDEDARRFINNPDKVRYDSQTSTLYCSKIFKWYRQDFLKLARSVQEYIRSYLETDVPLTDATSISYLYYDWNLNQMEKRG
ncbi:DUF547 domain-containing protein [Aerosakkonema funiforme]|uniref:DUF547 domain-containing protein n=1 Tax=Aerosakkonema funiforme FACHB-1375 TaxID=2949571 RepID=A0A926VHR1_9CYAN|nr:DUF547 domain-containing protein [Aerosakkonema funiforme]MBD2184126.1 DUF547 domain-containing protein [Aerosakkonema funiforme FACHB-1375]